MDYFGTCPKCRKPSIQEGALCFTCLENEKIEEKQSEIWKIYKALAKYKNIKNLKILINL